MKKLLPIILLLIAITLTFASCDFSTLIDSVEGFLPAEILELLGIAEPEEQTPTYKVMLSLPKGVKVKGDNPVTVAEGDTAKFVLEYESGYMFASLTEGYYDIGSQTVVVSGVYKDINTTMTVNKYDFNTSRTYRFFLLDTGKEYCNVTSGTMVNAGIVVNLKANDMTRRFIGWSYDEPYSSGGKIVSTDREFSFVMRAYLAGERGAVVVYPNYTDNNAVYYNPNGGSVNTSSVNYRDKNYYTASMTTLNSQRVLSLKIYDTYLSKVESISTLYDDGTFYRPGYVLTEYNTRADGRGESYSIGSKVYFSPDVKTPTLYCIWTPITPEDTFVYADHYMKNPASKASYAPDWNANGVIITQYTGNAETIVIPETIAGKPVIAIAEGAIVGKDVKTIIFNREIQKVENGAIQRCPGLSTIYFADSIYEMHNEALDSASYTSLTRVIVNATMAPRFAKSGDGAHSIKLSRLLAGRDEACIIMIGGSSIYEGVSTTYLEALFDGDYRFVNFGTTRTTHCTMYLEAMSYYAGEDDIVIYAPENSSYLLGERELYWKTMRDLEGMNNIYRYVDISQYTNFFSAFTDFNQTYRYKRAGVRYEDIAKVTNTDENGDHAVAGRDSYVNDSKYSTIYYHSLNNRTKSRFDTNSTNDSELNMEDYNNPNNETWCSIDDPYYLDPMNRIINAAKSSGAKVYFSFCPVDADQVVSAGKNRAWMQAYDALIADIYDYDGVVGKCEDYIYNHIYFFDNAFHLNDYGRTYRTYQLYVDLCDLLGKEDKHGIYDLGRNFKGCVFENRSTGKPIVGVDYLSEG